MTREHVEVSTHTPGWGVACRITGRGEANTIKEDGKARGSVCNLEHLVTNKSVPGKALGLGMGERNGEEGAVEEAFKDGDWDKQGRLSLSDIMGGRGGQGWEEEGRGQVSSPQSEGTLKCLQMGCRGWWSANCIWLSGSTAQRQLDLLILGEPFAQVGTAKSP